MSFKKVLLVAIVSAAAVYLGRQFKWVNDNLLTKQTTGPLVGI